VKRKESIHWVNKKWKIGGDVHAPMENKLKFYMTQI